MRFTVCSLCVQLKCAVNDEKRISSSSVLGLEFQPENCSRAARLLPVKQFNETCLCKFEDACTRGSEIQMREIRIKDRDRKMNSMHHYSPQTAGFSCGSELGISKCMIGGH